MAHDPDAGLVKRGFMLLGVMTLLGATVLFILYQGPRAAVGKPAGAEDYAWLVAVPGSGFPGNLSWGAVYGLLEHTPSAPGWEIRQNAAATLARRGSDQVSWMTFREMLDLRRMTANCREQAQDGKETPEASARDLVVVSLKALAEWHTKRREQQKLDVPSGLIVVYEMVDELARSADPGLREQAQKTQATFFRG
jgi:hypothetical protein